MPTVAIVTCAELPDLDPDEARIVAPLRDLGIAAVPAIWTDPSVAWDSFDLAVLRCPWDYHRDRAAFVDWARTVPRLVNDAATVEWNTDKRYLRELAAAGITTVDTTWFEPGAEPVLPREGVWVLKPAVGAGSRDAGRYDLASPAEHALAIEHVTRLLAEDLVVMAQPYMFDVDKHGETALIYIDGVYSHAITKAAMLDGPHIPNLDLYKGERITTAAPDEDQLAMAEAVLAAVPGDGAPLYARVDLIRDGDTLRLMELELTEPSLFYGHAPDSVATMAAAIARHVG
ncbi:ATP-grasp domain-containing protein [Stackebrandtia soli]|uniref:ATP-grasp domain-containing protein n=1 Tax=Stackebrandtia soli TaxID=1892856 RepID=UPI0039EA41B1